jgi:hypothetical protein
MAKPNFGFQKRQKELAREQKKKEKEARKEQRRAEERLAAESGTPPAEGADPGGEAPPTV